MEKVDTVRERETTSNKVEEGWRRSEKVRESSEKVQRKVVPQARFYSARFYSTRFYSARFYSARFYSRVANLVFSYDFEESCM